MDKKKKGHKECLEDFYNSDAWMLLTLRSTRKHCLTSEEKQELALLEKKQSAAQDRVQGIPLKQFNKRTGIKPFVNSCMKAGILLKTDIRKSKVANGYLPENLTIRPDKEGTQRIVILFNEGEGRVIHRSTGVALDKQTVIVNEVEYTLSRSSVLSIFASTFEQHAVNSLNGPKPLIKEYPHAWQPMYIKSQDLTPVSPHDEPLKDGFIWFVKDVKRLLDKVLKILETQEHEQRKRAFELELWKNKEHWRSYEGSGFSRPSDFYVDEFLSRFLTYKKNTSEKRKETAARAFIACLKDEPNLKMSQLTPAHCKTFLRALVLGKGYELGPLKERKQYLSSMFNEGVTRGFIPCNPAKNVTPSKLLKEIEQGGKAKK